MKQYCSCRERQRSGSVLLLGLISLLMLTTVSTLPGFWMRSAFTAWNTSTMPSVLQHSVALTREQNTPHRLTVSLHEMILCVRICICMCLCVYGFACARVSFFFYIFLQQQGCTLIASTTGS